MSVRKLRALVRVDQMTTTDGRLDRYRRGTLRFREPVVSDAQRPGLIAW